MPAVSKAQQKFFGIVRAIQKGEMAPTTPETAKASADMKRSDVKNFASTKHKGLPDKKVSKEEKDYDQKNKILKNQRSGMIMWQCLFCLRVKTWTGPRSSSYC